jgi:tripartite-type tricarboxylate transporter receptor subunit TctC
MIKSALVGALMCSALACAQVANAQTAPAQSVAQFYKGKTINIIVGSDVGGGYDLTARTVARHLARHIPGEPAIVVQNRPGAGSIIASNYVYEIAPRDGTVIGAVQRPIPFQILFGDTGVRFDVRKMQWIGSPTKELGVVVAWHTSPHNAFADVFKTEMIVGGTGPTTDPELLPRAMNSILGTKFKVVGGYKGQAQMVLAMQREEIHGSGNWSFSDIEKGHPDWLAEKKVRLLLQLGLAKSPNPALRDVPLILDVARNAEQRSIFQVLMGMKTMGRPFFIAPGVPKDRADAIRTAFMKTMKDPAFLAEAEKTLGQIDPLSGPEMQKIITDVHALPADIIAKSREAVKAPGA